MLTEAYIEALLVDEELADLVWTAWSVGRINDKQSSSSWLIIAARFVPDLRGIDNIPKVN